MYRNRRRGDRHVSHSRPGLRARAGAALVLSSLSTLVVASAAQAQSSDDRTYVYASSGVNLPAPVQAYGQDEVQAAGGVACRSSVGSGGPYVDAGVVGSNDLLGRQTTTAYARVVIPIGRAPARVDCTRLYDLEIQRLRMELQLARMNLPPEGDAAAAIPSAARARVTPPRQVIAAAQTPVQPSEAASATTVGEPATWESPGLRGSLSPAS